MEAADVQRKIEQGIPGAKAEVTGSDAHFTAVVVAEAFAGRTLVQQHQLVYATLRDEMASQQVHALALKTSAPHPAA
jgi:acid stress-induced BolA-like protein IbaG/YrbA